ncbi:hypothetical protein BJ742DRAFT_832007 [Cladochytrium replicatum]|nr:hypothetical protein BJ742DRAFT_832007 [Cladochytrium replicatum]
MKFATALALAALAATVSAQYGNDPPAPAATSTASTPGQYCNADKSFCVSAVVSGANVTVTYGCKATGWCAFGIGSSMSDADVVVGWNNGASFVISDRTSTGHALPAFDAVQAIAPATSPATLDASHTIKISYTRPVAASGSDKAFPSGSASFIYAMSNAAPSTPASSNSAFAQHNAGHAGFTAVLVAPSGGSGSTTGNGAAGSATAATGVLFLGLLSALFVM